MEFGISARGAYSSKYGVYFMNFQCTNIHLGLKLNFNIKQSSYYYRVGTEVSVDTETFRQATWNYIHLLYGLFHDDYRYDEVS